MSVPLAAREFLIGRLSKCYAAIQIPLKVLVLFLDPFLFDVRRAIGDCLLAGSTLPAWRDQAASLVPSPRCVWTITAGLHHWYVTTTSTQYWNGTWMGTRLRRCNAWLCGFFPCHSRQRRVSGPSRILGPSYLLLETAPPTTAFSRGPGYRSALVNLAAPMAFSFSAVGF